MMKGKQIYGFIALLILSLFGSMSLYSQSQTNNDYDAIFKPDHLLTQSQKDLKIKIAKLVCVSLEEQGDTIRCKAVESDFIKNDIPVYYYKRLCSDIKNLNTFIRSGKTTAAKVKSSLDELYNVKISKLP